MSYIQASKVLKILIVGNIILLSLGVILATYAHDKNLIIKAILIVLHCCCCCLQHCNKTKKKTWIIWLCFTDPTLRTIDLTYFNLLLTLFLEFSCHSYFDYYQLYIFLSWKTEDGTLEITSRREWKICQVRDKWKKVKE